jgi:hypothetical protein
MVRTMFEEEGKQGDSMVEILRDLAEFSLFWSHGTAKAV